MRKLRLDIDSLKVESFTAELSPKKSGTVHGRETNGMQTCDLLQTCNFADTCYGCSGDFCTGYCTGLGTGCYTDNPRYFACTGENPCTGAKACTFNTGNCYTADTCDTCPVDP
ncbi:MAG TPA: pinensin family lanthipeptide [Longimicrobium sp.]|jgi:hypothetical protein|nr:pinensin family lanthipeptide [Longimicrobium sp.]